MNFEPQKFFIGLMDFFTILLPGAILTFLVMDEAGPGVLGCEKYGQLEGVAGWGAFLISSYLLGHVVFLLGSVLDWPFDYFRKATRGSQIAEMTRGEPLRHRRVRRAADWYFGKSADNAHACASALRKTALAPVHGVEAMNVFQWCKAVLLQQSAISLALVQRFEADSKFFRSLTIVLLSMLLHNLAKSDSWLQAMQSLLWLVGAGFTIWRYADQRVKATNQAYWCLISLVAQVPPKASDPAGRSSEKTHAGGVVYKYEKAGATSTLKYLLVSATGNSNELVLPKGHIEPGEEVKHTAVREVLEESGVWASIEQAVEAIDEGEYIIEGTWTPVRARYYLMKYQGDGEAQEPGRTVKWLPLEEIKKIATSKNVDRDIEKAAPIAKRDDGRRDPYLIEQVLQIVESAENKRERIASVTKNGSTEKVASAEGQGK